MTNFLSWLISSSADPNKVGLTVKGLLIGVVPFLTWASPVLCAMAKVCIDLGSISPFIDGVANFVVAAMTLVSAAVVLFGLGRKISFGHWSAKK